MSDGKGRASIVAFAASALSSLGLMITYLGGGQPQLEGIFIFGALGGLGVGLILWAKDLMPGGHFVEERHPLRSSGSERRAVEADLEEGALLGRRSFIGRALAGALGMLGLAALFPIRSLGRAPGDSLYRTDFTAGARLVTDNGAPVSAAALSVGAFLTVFPEGHTGSGDSVAVLIKPRPELLPADEEAPQGLVAYSKICTHAGCPVGLFEVETNELFCPCHQSTFNVSAAARPTKGPATRPLPRLPIAIDEEGFVVATGDFTAPIGPGFWDLDG